MVAYVEPSDENFWIGPATEIEGGVSTITITNPTAIPSSCTEDSDCDDIDLQASATGNDGATVWFYDVDSTDGLDDKTQYTDCTGELICLFEDVGDFDTLGFETSGGNPLTITSRIWVNDSSSEDFADINVTMNPAATKLVTCSVNPSPVGENMTFNLTVTPAGFTGATQTPIFDCDGGGSLQTCATEGGTLGTCTGGTNAPCTCVCPGFPSSRTVTLACGADDTPSTGPYNDTVGLTVYEVFTDRAPFMLAMSGGSAVGGGKSATAASDSVISDDFNRADDNDIDATGSLAWTEIEPNATTCEWDISSQQLRANVGSDTTCDTGMLQVRADSDLGGTDHWVKVQRILNSGLSRIPGFVLRSQSGADLGNHYFVICVTSACNAMRVQHLNAQTWQANLNPVGDCDGPGGSAPADLWSTWGPNDYAAAEVEGDVVRLWNFGDTDPGGRSNWGTAHCTITLTSNPVTTGERVGLGFYSADDTSGDNFLFDNFDAGLTP